MMRVLILSFCFWTCQSLPIATVETTVSDTTPNPFANLAFSAPFLSRLPPQMKEGMMESLRLQTAENVTKEEVMDHLEKTVKEHGTNHKTDGLLLKVLSALMDYSMWFKGEIKKQSPDMQEVIRIINKQTQDEKYLALSPEEKQAESVRSILHLNITQEDLAKMNAVNRQGDEMVKQLKIADLSREYFTQLVKERDAPTTNYSLI